MKKIFLLIIVFALVSCEYKDSEEPKYNCDPQKPPNFSDVQPILLSKCSIAGCHNGSKATIPTLVTIDQFKKNATDSKDQILSGAMPPAEQLTQFDKAKIICWIDSGAN